MSNLPSRVIALLSMLWVSAADLLDTHSHNRLGTWRVVGAALGRSLTTATSQEQGDTRWADSAWHSESVSRGLVRDSSLVPVMWSADFDGDGRRDVAWLVKLRLTGARGVLIVHASGRPAQLCGAGVRFGNGGDNFDWLDRWKVVPSRSGRGSSLLVEKMEAASGRIEFQNGRYRWLQVGD